MRRRLPKIAFPREGGARLLGTSSAARTPFVLLVVLLLGAGLLALLLLNAAVNQGSFQLSKLRKETTDLTDKEQELRGEIDAQSAPDALARRARELGMVPGGPPVFLTPEGEVRGKPDPADAAPLPVPAPAPRPAEAAKPSKSPSTSTSASVSPSPSPSVSPSPSAGKPSASGSAPASAAGPSGSPSSPAPRTPAEEAAP